MTTQECVDKIRRNLPEIESLPSDARRFIEGYLKRCEDEKREACLARGQGYPEAGRIARRQSADSISKYTGTPASSRGEENT